MVEVVLRAVRVDVGSSTPLLLLEEVSGERVLPIFIGAPEATSIAYALQQIETPRPMAHDLLGNVIEALGGRLFSVEVTGLVDNTFFASLRILNDGVETLVSARPSDAIAVALRVGAPILVNDELMANEGKYIDLADEQESFLEVGVDDDADNEGDEIDESNLVAELRAFLDNVKPEDFDS